MASITSTSSLSKLTPYGVFFIAAATAGTISFAEVSRLQTYLVTYTVLVAVLTLVVLPLLVTAVTPFKYRDLLAIPRDTLITIFAAAKIIVLMPQLIENVRELFRRYDLEDKQVESGAAVLMPLAYPFPNLGTYVILMFVPFASWYLGGSFDLADQLTLQGASLLSTFVAPIIGIPFLLDIMRIPADIMELFVMSTVYTDRIRVVLGAMHLLVLTIVVLAVRRGVFKVKVRRLLIVAAVSVLSLGAGLLGTRAFLAYVVSDGYQGEAALVKMRWLDRRVATRVYRDRLPPADPRVVSESRAVVVRERGTVRVGFLPDALPFAFSNEHGEVTGFDIELAHHLARDLGVELELVKVKADDINALFGSGQIDIVMSGMAMTADRIGRWDFGGSPVDLTLALLVADYRRKEFRGYNALQHSQELSLGVVQSDRAFQRQLQGIVPNAVIMQLDSPREFLRGNLPEVDAVVYSAEGGSAWTLIYPEYAVVVPQPRSISVPAGYPVPRGDAAWSRYIGEWAGLKRKDGTVAALFDHWILGQGAQSTAPRWSIVRDVLAWID